MKGVIFNKGKRRGGSSLLIVLAFLLLLTTLVVAFLSRATLERTLANASLSQGKSDLVAQGSIASIISDLQAEIIAGSNGTGTPTLASGYYYPTSAANMVPYPVLGGINHVTPASPPTTTSIDGLENLMKISYRGAPFFTGSSYSTTGPTRAPSAAAAVSTTVASLNNRTISTARWNAPLLLTKATPTSTTDYTPVSKFVAPDWIYVARDGTNPSTWDTMYASNVNVSPTSTATSGSAGTNPVTQRYAYAIYDEGGLLDVNVAGNPSYTAMPAASAWVYSSLQPYKNALTYADLAQLPYLNTTAMTVAGGNSTTLSLANQIKLINAIVGWRNNSSAPRTSIDSFPTYSKFDALIPSGSKSQLNIPYTGYPLDYFVLNAGGFLNAGGLLPMLGNNGNVNVANQTDSAFSGRQQLIQFFTQGLGQNSTFSSSLAGLQNALQYLGTFSRDVNQPSYAPSPTRPTVLTAASGGNNAYGLDSAINPAFLGVTVGTSFTRNDGTTAVVGEPLVKKRFALNRIAWLTCKGPICTDDAGTLSTDTTVQTIINSYEKTYGIPASFLQQGGPANILKYFGLQWDSTNLRWIYMHGRNGDATTLSSGLPSPVPGAIMKLKYAADESGGKDVYTDGREADFFELLKATATVGAIAKPVSIPPTGGAYTGLGTNFVYQYDTDVSVDYAIVQLGANIIAQFTPDNFPPHILFDDGSGTVSNLPTGTATFSGTGGLEFRGVKNLPYINKVRNAFIKVVNPVTSMASPYNSGFDQNVGAAWNSTADLSNTGVGAYMIFPDLWNPNDWNTSSTTWLNQTVGVTGPTYFRIFAVTDTQTYMGGTCGGGLPPGNNSYDASPPVDQTHSPGYNTTYQLNWAGEKRGLTQANTEMDFQIPATAAGAGLFRESTLLFQAGIPTGSNLTAPKLVSTNTGTLGLGLIASASNSSFFAAGGGLISGVGDTTPTPSYGGLPVQGNAYIGFYVNTNPLWWVRNVSYTAPTGGPVEGASTGAETLFDAWQTACAGTLQVHYYLQCNDPSNTSGSSTGAWITYDEKWDVLSGNPNCDVMKKSSNSFLNGIQRGQAFTASIDPRSTRFGFLWSGAGLTTGNQFCFPPFYQTGCDGWINQAQGVVMGTRSGSGPGATGLIAPSSQLISNSTGWYNTVSSSWSSNQGEPMFRSGFLCQNNPSTTFTSDGTPYDINPPSTVIASNPPFPNEYYADPDGVVRRGMDAYVYSATKQSSTPLESAAANAPGQPMATANTNGTTRDITIPSQSASRPMILNRPFNSVAELGYVFSGTPWKNIDFFTPESGYAALLDTFCISDTQDASGLVAGKVDLNTRQAPVIQAVVAEAYKDQWSPSAATVLNQNQILGGSNTSLAGTIASTLVARTTSTGTTSTIHSPGPLTNLADLVGRWIPGSSTFTPTTGGTSCYAGLNDYDGFSADLSNVFSASTDTSALIATGDTNVERLREATMRSLANCGTTRVWNLMIDVIAQTGRFPSSAGSLANFAVEGERRYWVHVAIDRYTGKVLDEQIEEVKE